MLHTETGVARMIAASALVGAVVFSQATPTEPGQRAVAEALRSAPSKVQESIAQLSAIEPAPLAELVELCGRDRVPQAWLPAEEEPLPLTVVHQAVIVEALGTFEAAALFAHLHAVERGEREVTRRSALLRLVGNLGGAGELGLLAKLATPLDAGPLPERARSAYEASVRALTERDPVTLHAMRSVFGTLDLRLVASTVSGLEGASVPGLVDGLAELLNQVPEADGLLVSAITRAAERARPPFEASTRTKVRIAFSGGRPRRNALVVAAIGALEDYEGISILVEALQKDDPNLRRAAAQALRKVTGQNYGLEAMRWAVWYRAEQRWWNEEAGEAFSVLRHGESSEAVGVIRELAQRGLFRHELAELACDGLEREEPEVFGLVCQLLRDLNSIAAVEPLRRAVDYSNLDQGSRELALATLEAIAPGEAEREIQ